MSILTSDIADRLRAEQGFDIVIPDLFTSIEEEAFTSIGLTSVDIPASIEIADNAFDPNVQITTRYTNSDAVDINDDGEIDYPEFLVSFQKLNR